MAEWTTIIIPNHDPMVIVLTWSLVSDADDNYEMEIIKHHPIAWKFTEEDGLAIPVVASPYCFDDIVANKWAVLSPEGRVEVYDSSWNDMETFRTEMAANEIGRRKAHDEQLAKKRAAKK